MNKKEELKDPNVKSNFFVTPLTLVKLGTCYNVYPYTWCNNREHHSKVKVRLDRFLADESWISLFPNYYIIHLPKGNYDHIPILCDLHGVRNSSNQYQVGPKSFKFEQLWSMDEECENIILESWSDHDQCSILEVQSLLHATSDSLRKWAANTYGYVGKKIRNLQNSISHEYERGTLKQKTIKDLEEELSKLLEAEELIWKQRARITWLKECDHNTYFFHAKASQRRRKILHLKDHKGNWHEEE